MPPWGNLSKQDPMGAVAYITINGKKNLMKKVSAIFPCIFIGTLFCGNIYAFETYIPHITGGVQQWDDYLQVNNNTASEESYTITLYNNGAEVYSQVHTVAALTRSEILLKNLNANAQIGIITYAEPGLNFRVSYEYMTGGVAEFKSIDTLAPAIGLYFSDFIFSMTSKGAAIANLGTTPAEVTLYALAQGVIQGTFPVTIQPMNKIVGLHSNWFPDLDFDQVESIIAVTSSPALCGIAISSDDDLSHLLFTAAAPVVNFDSNILGYPIVGTNQTKFYDNTGEITAPEPGEPYYGQDASFPDSSPDYTDNGDGTITDNITGLMWVKERGSKVTWDAAVAGAATNDTGGYNDWRMPTIKELYSIFLHSGANGNDYFSMTGYIPFIDTDYFDFVYGSGIGDERVIDCQDWSGTEYVSTTQYDQPTIFGINFADGRSKGYKKFLPPTWTEYNELYVRYVRGNPNYGINDFQDNDDGTVSDLATGLMWSKSDSGEGLNWPDALAWVQTKNSENYLEYSDWRLPNIKELHSIVDYTRSPEKTSSAAIDTDYFTCSTIINEANQVDYPYFWSGTVLVDGPSTSGCYIPFGRAMAYLDGLWQDVHGAGSQKSDVMIGDPANFPTGRGPQGDAVRIYNYIRLVRDM